MSPEDFYQAVQTALPHGAADREQILADLKDILDLGVSTDDLGDPVVYALSASASDTAEKKAPRYSRVWDPMNPAIFVPRVVGLGWDLNLGAVAVKLGWLRPDDMDEDVIEAIPERALALTKGLPAAGAIITVVASAVALSRSSGQLPSGWDYRFRPRKLTSNTSALLPGLLLSGGATAWASLAKDRHDILSRSVFATSLSFVGAGTAILAARSARLGNRSQPVTGFTSLLLGPLALSLVTGLAPVREGLKQVWQKEGLSR